MYHTHNIAVCRVHNQ